MKAAYTTAYGGPQVIEIRDVAKPLPRKGEVLVRIHAAAVTAGDARLRGLDVPAGFGLPVRLMFGWSRPRRPVLGWCFAGTIDALGPQTSSPKIGTPVMGIAGMKGGAHADYIAISPDRILPLPDGLTMDEGAGFFFGGLAAQDFLMEKAGLQSAEHVLINGATGSVGSAAVQMAKAAGAQVTAVCSAPNAGLARAMGADQVVDYRHEAIEGHYDVVMNVIGTLPHAKALPVLRTGGRLILITAGFAATLAAALRPHKDCIRRIAGTAPENRDAMLRLVQRYKAGSYRPHIGKVMPFAEIRAAHAMASARHKAGNLILRMI